MSKIGPFLHHGLKSQTNAFIVLVALLVPNIIYASLYSPTYFAKLTGYILFGILIEMLLRVERKPRSVSGGLTAALIVSGIPASCPPLPILFSILLALGITKHSPLKKIVRFNAAMFGRLFLMLAYNQHTVNYGKGIDAITTATPLELYKSEDYALSLKEFAWGKIDGNWEDLFTIIPGSPGETFPIILIIIGLLLFIFKIANWRAPLGCLAGFIITTLSLGEPLLFSVFAGSILFSIVFIVSDPLSAPTSKSGRIIYGLLVGILTAILRKHTYYTETVVFAVLIGNLITPLLDYLAFQLRAIELLARNKPSQ